MKRIKKIIKNYLKKRGLAIEPFDQELENLKRVKYNWLKNYSIETIIDIGASDGGFAKKARKLFPHSKIYSFEPIYESYIKLKNNFKDDKLFKAFNIACSDKNGISEFYLSSRVGSSSLFNMGTMHKIAYPDSANISQIKVKTDLLDSILLNEEFKPEILLKLDVQGGELIALSGAKQTLKKAKLALLEVSFCELYDNQPLINEVIDFMKNENFIIVGIENVSYNNIDGKCLQADIFFERTK